MSVLPKLCQKPARTVQGAVRQYNAALRAYQTRFAGGGAFGWDWPTLRMNCTETYDFLTALRATWSNHT